MVRQFVSKIQLTETTPLVRLNRLEAYFGNQNQILIKRDDIGSIGGGGNKLRKLEYSVAEALSQQCDTLITFGALQSNHARLTAAVAAHCGLKCILILNKRVDRHDVFYTTSGNVLLNQLFGADVHILDAEQDPLAYAAEIQIDLVKAGHKPYIIPFGGSDALGALGYADCIVETYNQAKDQNVTIDHVFHASGSGGTQAGLVVGCEQLSDGSHLPKIHGISVLAEASALKQTVHRIANEARTKLGLSLKTNNDSLNINDQFVGEGYGITNDETLAAIQLLASTEGILLDPVYTGKAFAGLIHLLQQKEISQGETIVFLHTGGMPGLFAYSSAFSSVLTN